MNKRIKTIRRILDLTQQEFADRIGVKRNTIANYETGRNTPIDSVISLICREFKINENWLRNGVGDMFVPDPSDEIDSLAQRYPNLTHDSLVFIDRLVHQSSENQTVIMNFLRDVVAGFGDVPAGTLANQVSRDQLHATLDAQLEQEKEATDESAVS